MPSSGFADSLSPIYKERTIYQMMFAWWNAQRELIASVSAKDSCEMFLKKYNISEDMLALNTAMNKMYEMEKIYDSKLFNCGE